jgi:ASPIC and UnbV
VETKPVALYSRERATLGFAWLERSPIAMRSGASVTLLHGASSQSRLVKGGSSYLSQSELPVTFGLGKRDKVDRLVIQWPSGRTEEYKNLAAGRTYECVESKGITALSGFSRSFMTDKAGVAWAPFRVRWSAPFQYQSKTLPFGLGFGSKLDRCHDCGLWGAELFCDCRFALKVRCQSEMVNTLRLRRTILDRDWRRRPGHRRFLLRP